MNHKYEERKSFIINILFFGLIAVLLYLAVKYLLGWLLPFIIGFVVAILLKGVSRFVSKKCRLPYKVAAVILVLLFYAVVSVLLTLLATKIILVLKDGFASLPTAYTLYIEPLIKDTLDKLESLTAKLDPGMAQITQNMKASLSDSAGSLVTGLSTQVLKYLSSTIFSLPSILLATLLSIISSVFFAVDFGYITGYVLKLLPVKARGYAGQLRKIAANIVVKYIKSYAILVSVTFAELSIGFLIIGVANPIVIAALIAFVDLLPLLGTGSVVIPWVIVKLVQGNYVFAIELAVLYIVITVVRNVLEPRIVGRQIGIHPLAMLVSMYVGLKLFGFVGIFVLPILLVVLKGFYDHRTPPEPAPPGPDAIDTPQQPS
ncbi:sporulation integral membrane protein YtvI [Sporobacter termitidis DSM 10068]|uniref:Sporulation integral membrane protein YtvI n=1 Tax=Sporobacter termitidis DSM 10068 TaxID=1123282 RepID=A0A1M5Y6C6_9FIRM|nr:sporulation integral membrane protein YtvI [Sporobacter termitidis]SHI07607.1 sporulation integral membrane protein YtvI [Sporobacter termitidis DSM 10068]